jgi:exopolysaccharide production protein ExoQ
MDGVIEHTAPAGTQVRPRVDVAATLTFTALAALILDPLFGSAAALVFLLFGGLLMMTQPLASLRAFLRYWYVLILPAYCLFSFFWSQYPSLTLRYSVQLAISMAIAIVIANRVAPVTLLRCLFGIYGLGVGGSLLFGRVRDDIGAWIGIFGSKNAFAAVVSGFLLTAIAVALDRSAHPVMRIAALAGLVVSGPLLVAAKSTGAILIVVPAAAVVLGLIASRRLTRLQAAFICLIVAAAGVLVALIAAGYGDLLLENVLAYSGKDVTLTGRTDLWEFGRQIIEEHPLLGLGYQAFWVHGNAPAEVLWAAFGIEPRSGFNFHNTYISNAVEIGMVGVAIQVVLLYGALAGVLLWALRSPRPENAFLAAFLTMVICGSFVEVAVFFQFSITTTIVTCAFVYASRANKAWKAHVQDTLSARERAEFSPRFGEELPRPS